jgi:hypothetical protein
MIRPLRVVFFVLAALPLSGLAATFCASTAGEFASAFATAAGNGEDDLIQLSTGIFVPTSAEFFLSNTEAHSIVVEGGYDIGCTTIIGTPASTVLSGTGGKIPLDMSAAPPGGDMTVRNLSVRGGLGVGSFAPFHVGGGANYAGNITLENLLVIGNTSTQTVIDISSDLGQIIVRNVVLSGNTASGPFPLISIVNNFAGSGTGVVFNNNTITANHIGNAAYTGGVLVSGSGSATLGNNVLWGNDGVDLRLMGTANKALDHNDIQDLSGSPASNIAAVNVNPQAVAASDYRLIANSPLVNGGSAAVPGGIGTLDAASLPRVVSSVDIGAFEVQEEIFAGDFE